MTIETNRIDDAVRGHHRASLERLSLKVRAQLAQGRHAALHGTSAHRVHGLGYAAAAFTTLCALAIGMQFRNPPSPGPTPAVVIADVTANASRAESTMLDQDPDFYAWLASPDAMQVALE